MPSLPFCFLEQFVEHQGSSGAPSSRETTWTQCFFTEWFLKASYWMKTALFQLPITATLPGQLEQAAS